MATIYQNQEMIMAHAQHSPPGKGLKIATIVFGVMGMITWTASIGFMIGWESYYYDCNSDGAYKTTYGWFISVPANAASLYVTSRIIFLITSMSFPNPELLTDLRECVARMVAFGAVILTMWATSLSWLVKDSCEPTLVYHVCNYGFIDSALVAGFAGGLYRVTSNTIRHQGKILQGTDNYALAPLHIHRQGN